MADVITPVAAPARIAAGDLARANVPLILLSLALGAFALGTSEFAAMSLLPEIARATGLSEPVAAHAVSAYALGVVVGAPLIAVAGARLRRRHLLIGVLALFAAGNLASALAPSFTMLLGFRFVSGLPHGAYLGVASLVAASLVPRGRRARAVSTVLLGLTSALILGVALVTALGQSFGWRLGFAVPGLIAAAVAVLIAVLMPQDAPPGGAGPLGEIRGLRDRRIWLTLATAAIGFAGLFAVYSYTASTLMTVTGVDRAWVPVLIALFGVGMTLGTLAAGWLADRALMATPALFLLAGTVSLVGYTVLAGSLPGIAVAILAVSFFCAIGGVLQTRLMDVAGEAQTSAAVLNHSAFNLANALGPWLAGMAISQGHGFASSGLVGAALAFGGLLIWLFAWWDERRSPSAPA